MAISNEKYVVMKMRNETKWKSEMRNERNEEIISKKKWNNMWKWMAKIWYLMTKVK